MEDDRDEQILKSVNKFWNVDAMGLEEVCDSVSIDFHKSLEFTDRHYSVQLPWKSDPELLPDNYSSAKSPLYPLYYRLLKTPEKLKKYDDITGGAIPEMGRTHYLPQ